MERKGDGDTMALRHDGSERDGDEDTMGLEHIGTEEDGDGDTMGLGDEWDGDGDTMGREHNGTEMGIQWDGSTMGGPCSTRPVSALLHTVQASDTDNVFVQKSGKKFEKLTMRS